jgi:hypothetical protein
MTAALKQKLFVFGALIAGVVFLAAMQHIGAQQSTAIDPHKVDVINFDKGGYELYDKSSPFAQEIIRKAYGPYADWVLK